MGSITRTLAAALAVGLFTTACGSGGAAGPGTAAVPDFANAPGDASSGDTPPGDTPPGDTSPVTPVPSTGTRFKVVHWNVQSGYGKAGWTGSGGFTPGSNCATNAWGNGNGPLAKTLVERVKHDGDVVALTLNEAWTCATPARIKALLGFAAMAEQAEGGVSVVARYGFAAAPQITLLPKCSSTAEPRWVIRAPVYADAARRTIVQVFATHWTGCAAEGQATRALMEPYNGTPRSLTGDLNVKSLADAPIAALRGAGYADAWSSVHGTSGGATGTWNGTYGSPKGNLYKRIDYAFSKTLTVRSVARFNHDGAPGVPKMADHAGLVIEYAR